MNHLTKLTHLPNVVGREGVPDQVMRWALLPYADYAEVSEHLHAMEKPEWRPRQEVRARDWKHLRPEDRG